VGNRHGPDLGDVKNIPAVILSLLGSHDLHLECPAWIFTAGNGFEEISGGMIRICSGQTGCFLASQVFDTLICFEVVFDPEIFTLIVYTT